MNKFSIPREVYFGKGSLEYLKTLTGRTAAVVTGGNSMKALGFLDKTLKYLEEAGLKTCIVDNVEPDPSIETVMRGAKILTTFEPDWIIALGGGSAIDAAKAMWVFYEHPDTIFEELVKPGGVPDLRKKARFLAIPSTSGTASEVTASSVISNYSTQTKSALRSYSLIPDIAILDSDLAEAMPPQLAAYTGMDALTHAIEAYVATLANPFSSALAVEATGLIFSNLSNSYAGDHKARELMHYAQSMAGMAFANSMLGITHSLAHASGLVFNIPHGAANAIFLPFVIQFNQKTAAAGYAAMARHLNLKGSTDQELSTSLWQAVQTLQKNLNIASSLKKYGVEKDIFTLNLPVIVEKALRDRCTTTNPRPCTQSEMEKIFLAAYEGNNIDF